MANLIFAQYVPDAIIYDVGTQVAYHYVGTTASAPNADVADITEQNIPIALHTYADPQGKKTYSKCEHAVSFYLDDNTGLVDLPTANTPVNIFTAPSAGVIRVYFSSVAPVFPTRYIYVNGTLVKTLPGTIAASKEDSWPINLNNGDVVSAASPTAGQDALFGFLPDTY